MRIPRRLALLAIGLPALLATPVHASADPWPQYQGGAARTGLAPDGTPEPPYAVSWSAATGIGDPTQVLGTPSPIVAGEVAIVVGRESVDAVDVSSGSPAWSVPRALGPSSAAAVDGDTLVYAEGGGAGGASSTPTTAAPSTTSATPSATASPAASPDVSTLVGVSLTSQKRLWSVPLTDVSHTGVVIANHEAFVGTDDGTVTAVDLDGTQTWGQSVGDHVLAPIAATGDVVLAVARPEGQGTAALVALRQSDGSTSWRYEPSAPVQDLGGPSVGVGPSGKPAVYIVGSDASVRAIDANEGTQLWAVALYSPTLGSPPAVGPAAVVVADETGTVYALDPATGAERWRFATNISAIGPPVLTPTSVIQPLSDGSVAAISLTSGHETWDGSTVDGAIFGLAAAPGLLVAAATGTSPGLVALAADPAGATEDIVSPTTPNAARLILGWVGAAIPLVVVSFLIGRSAFARLGPARFEDTDGEEPVDPWEPDEDT